MQGLVIHQMLACTQPSTQPSPRTVLSWYRYHDSCVWEFLQILPTLCAQNSFGSTNTVDTLRHVLRMRVGIQTQMRTFISIACCMWCLALSLPHACMASEASTFTQCTHVHSMPFCNEFEPLQRRRFVTHGCNIHSTSTIVFATTWLHLNFTAQFFRSGCCGYALGIGIGIGVGVGITFLSLHFDRSTWWVWLWIAHSIKG